MNSTLIHLCQYYDLAPVNSASPLFSYHTELIFIITSCIHNVLFMFSWTITLEGPSPHVVNCREGLQGCPLEGKKVKAFRGPTAGGAH